MTIPNVHERLASAESHAELLAELGAKVGDRLGLGEERCDLLFVLGWTAERVRRHTLTRAEASLLLRLDLDRLLEHPIRLNDEAPEMRQKLLAKLRAIAESEEIA
jgi:hypothetical protein